VNSPDTRHSVSVAGVIVDDHDRALLIQRRDTQRWEPPGGVLEPGETIHDGLRREVREETGLDIEPITLTGVYKNMVRAIVALVFRCEASPVQPLNDHRHRTLTDRRVCHACFGETRGAS
jgi:8-oxo-dGTP diphosphatase